MMIANTRPITAIVALGIGWIILSAASGSLRGADQPNVCAGVAVQVITPDQPMWMAGYGSRNKPAEGKVHDLYVKALAIEHPRSGKFVLLTSDLVGISRDMATKVTAEVQRRTGVPRERIMLTCSHTHCGPVTRDALVDMYDMPPEEAKKIGPYTEKLRGWMIETICKALADMKPAKLTHGKGTARFAVNRREPTDKGIINGFNPTGPVDHDVPVLRVETAGGKLLSVVFGYACHNTTMQFYQWCGDYAGFAQAYVEEKHPGAVAMFWIGTGGDANPLPRSKIELCQKYGRELADAVEGVLAQPMQPIQGAWASKYAEISLPFATLPDKEQLAKEALSKGVALQRRAVRLLKQLETKGQLDDHYPYYPVQFWRLGTDLHWIALGGEVVIDYNLRLKRELADKPHLWITGYANDVMAYIPSARNLREGGYEADSSMVYYGMPTKWSEAIEDRIVGKVLELVREVR